MPLLAISYSLSLTYLSPSFLPAPAATPTRLVPIRGSACHPGPGFRLGPHLIALFRERRLLLIT